MSDLLIEIGTEEMPAEAIDCEALPQFKSNLIKFAEDNRLKINWDKVKISATPRRLFAFIPDFPLKQEPAVMEIKGPPVKVAYKDGKPTQAVAGFAKAQNLKTSELITKDTGAGEYVFGIKKEEGAPSAKLLEENLPKIIKSINFKRSMRWKNTLTFVRPIRWLCCLHGNKLINIEIDGIKSNRVTYGHRLLDNVAITLKNSSDYFDILQKAKVSLVKEDRAKKIKKELNEAANKIKGRVNWQKPRINQTFEEVTNLVEWPTTVVGRFEKEYLVLPDIVIETVLQSHQRYLPVENSSGLMSSFLVVHNGNPRKNELIKQGHERVVRARLDDGMFFFEEDIKIPLNHRVEMLKGITFHEELGTVFDKQERIREISQKLAKKIGLDKKTTGLIKEAAPLLKADLVTSIVGEFAELQGSIGKEYALVAGLNKNVAEAIYEHYLPRFKNDDLPKTRLGSLLSIADKLDSIVAHFAIGNIPTSAGDPFGLRRQANGLVKIILNEQFHLPVNDMIRTAYKTLLKQKKIAPEEEQLIKQVTGFMTGRLERILSSQAIDYDIIRSLMSKNLFDFADVIIRAEALKELRNTPKFEDLMTAYSRCLNLGKNEAGVKINENRLVESHEKVFFKKLLQIENKNKRFISSRKYFEALKNLADLRKVIDDFFDTVLVMDKDLKIQKNRISLLNRFVTDCNEVADLSELVIPG